MFSCTTVDSIWLSGFGGMLTTPVDASSVQPNFSTYAVKSSPATTHMVSTLMPIHQMAFERQNAPERSRYVPSRSLPMLVNAALTALTATSRTESSNPAHSTV